MSKQPFSLQVPIQTKRIDLLGFSPQLEKHGLVISIRFNAHPTTLSDDNAAVFLTLREDEIIWGTKPLPESMLFLEHTKPFLVPDLINQLELIAVGNCFGATT